MVEMTPNKKEKNNSLKILAQDGTKKESEATLPPAASGTSLSSAN